MPAEGTIRIRHTALLFASQGYPAFISFSLYPPLLLAWASPGTSGHASAKDPRGEGWADVNADL